MSKPSQAPVTPNHLAQAVTLLNREYGKGHPADPGCNFTVCFRTTSYAHQERELAQLIADAEQRARELERAAIGAYVNQELGDDVSEVVGAILAGAHLPKPGNPNA